MPPQPDARRCLLSRRWIVGETKMQVDGLPGAHELEFRTLDGKVTRKQIHVPPDGLLMRVPD
ncbi:MAG: hypothetical protein JNM84_06960 [Planctomycetes bacterium]|nr:hypothetical protein [Planctomycetota bacterium]